MKKSLTTNWQRTVLVIASWVVRLNGFTLAAAVALLLLLVFAASLNPEPPTQQSSRLAVVQAEQAQQERRLLAQARPVPPTGRINLNFGKLNFPLPPAAQLSNGYGVYVPTDIKSYDGREVRIQGFMLPTKLEGGLVTDCLVLSNQLSCCFGLEPRFCQFIAVHIDGPGATNQMDEPLRFEGKLRVGDIFVNGVWVALYSMNCTAVKP